MTLLTDPAVRRFKGNGKRRLIKDDGMKSLFLVIAPDGAKSWMMRFRRPDGRPAKIVLGPLYSGGEELLKDPEIGVPLTLAGAHKVAADIHLKRARGEDVVADHKARKHRQRAVTEEREAAKFAGAVRAYIDEYGRPKTRNWIETARLLGLRYEDADAKPEQIKGGLVQRWGDRDVRSIDAHDIWSVVDEAKRLGSPGIVARNPKPSDARQRMLYVALSSLFSWLKRQRRVDSSPCAGVSRPDPAKQRDRVLSADELRWFWRATDMVGEPFGTIFKLLLLTGARLNEVAGLRRDELSSDSSMWSLPGSRTKNARPQVVPLAPMARALIATVPGQQQIIFSTTGTTAPSGWSRAKHRLDAAMLTVAQKERGKNLEIPAWRLHDLRRSAVTGMAELGIRPDVIELCVNHVSGTRGGIAGVYNRSEQLPERKAALERWAAHVAGLVSGTTADVINLSRQGGAA